MLYKKVVLKSLFIFRWNYYRITFTWHWSLRSPSCTKTYFTEQKSEYFIRLWTIPMNIDMPCVHNQILKSYTFINHLLIILFAEICNIDCGINPRLLLPISHYDSIFGIILKSVDTDNFDWRLTSDNLDLMVHLSPLRRIAWYLSFHNFIYFIKPYIFIHKAHLNLADCSCLPFYFPSPIHDQSLQITHNILPPSLHSSSSYSTLLFLKLYSLSFSQQPISICPSYSCLFI